MEDYRLPAPLVGMLKASKLTGKPIVKTELLPTKLHVVITWDLATSAPKKTKKRQLKKTANTEFIIDRTPSLRLTDSLLRRHQRLLLQLQLLSRQSSINPAPKRCHLKWQLDGWGLNRWTNAPSRRLHQLQNALPRRQTRLQKTTLPRFNAAPRHNRLTPLTTHP